MKPEAQRREDREFNILLALWFVALTLLFVANFAISLGSIG